MMLLSSLAFLPEKRRRSFWQRLPFESKTILLLVVMWYVSLFMGEYILFRKSIASCSFDTSAATEDSNITRIIMISDPQLTVSGFID